jgi:long-chain acyl-CoA synthetase
VFGIPDDEYGERLCAYIELEPGSQLSAKDVQAYLVSRLANFKVPKDIKFIDLLPREASGKIFKRKIRDPYWESRIQN